MVALDLNLQEVEEEIKFAMRRFTKELEKLLMRPIFRSLLCTNSVSDDQAEELRAPGTIDFELISSFAMCRFAMWLTGQTLILRGIPVGLNFAGFGYSCLFFFLIG